MNKRDEGLFKNDIYLEDFGEVAKGKGGEKTRVEESLPAPCPYIPIKTEKSSTS